MKIILFMLIMLILLVLTIGYSLVLQEKVDESPYCTGIYSNHTKAYVTRVIDGDTFDISSNQRVRIICIDTPEKYEEGYEEAKDRLTELIYQKYVCLQRDVSEVDMYGRLLRYVYICLDRDCSDGVNVGNLLVGEGFARVYRFGVDVKGCFGG